MEVRFGAVARVAAACEALADAHRLPRAHGDAPPPEMAQGHEHRPAPVAGPQDHVVARERGPALRGTTALGEGVADRGKTSVGVVVLLPVVDAVDLTVHRAAQLPAEAGEGLRRFGPQEASEPERCGAAPLVDRDQIDRMRQGEPPGPVARHPIRRGVLDLPAAPEREREEQSDPAVHPGTGPGEPSTTDTCVTAGSQWAGWK